MNADELIAELTVNEVVGLCSGSDFWHTKPIERLAVPAIRLADGPHGLRVQPESADHLGLSASLPSTCFPTASALGSSWDPNLVAEVGAAMGREARALGVGAILGPGLNIKRSPLCGRNFEYFSEDPLLSGTMAAGMVAGIQSENVGACVKHFAAQNQETDRLRVSADVDDRTLREIYLSGFEYVITHARPWMVMSAYNRLNGTYAAQHEWLLTTVLRDEWGFDGMVVSDWGAVENPVDAVRAGTDLQMPPHLGVSEARLRAAIDSGEIDEAIVRESAYNVLTLVQRAGTPHRSDFDAEPHHSLARTAATESAVLLRNDDDALPLRPRAGQTIGVVGELARSPRYQGAGSSQVVPTRLDTPLDEIRVAAPDGIGIEFAAGYTLDHQAASPGLLAEARALAARSDTVVVFLGLPAADESEGFDRTHLDIPASQVAALRAIAAANDEVVVVLANGGVVTLASWEGDAKAVLEMWLSGQGAGRAIADLLFGKANPSGRLAETIPRRLEDNPSFLNFPGDPGHVRYGEGVFVGYRGYDASTTQVSYPFGHGLSYTTFDYTDLSVDVEHETGQALNSLGLRVALTVKNTGPVPGKEVVQVYVHDESSPVQRPPQELRAYRKLTLQPKEATRVEFELSQRDLSYWSTEQDGWRLAPGQYEIRVGASSRDIRLVETVTLSPRVAPRTLSAESTLDEWYRDPAGQDVLLSDPAAAGLLAVIEDEQMLRVIGSFPIGRLAAFQGMGMESHELERLVAVVNDEDAWRQA